MPAPLRERRLAFEKACLQEAIAATRTKQDCAKYLGVSRPRLDRLLGKHGLLGPQDPRTEPKRYHRQPWFCEIIGIKDRLRNRIFDSPYCAFYFEGLGNWEENCAKALGKLDVRLHAQLVGKTCRITREDRTQLLRTIALTSYGWRLS